MFWKTLPLKAAAPSMVGSGSPAEANKDLEDVAVSECQSGEKLTWHGNNIEVSNEKFGVAALEDHNLGRGIIFE